VIRLLVAPGSLVAGRRVVAGEDYHYLFRVRRLGTGDRLVLFDGEGQEAACEVVRVDGRAAELTVEAIAEAPPAPGRIAVAMPILKGERTDWCLPKLVELGAARIIPLITERTVVRLEGERADRRWRRYRAQVRAAAQQCRSSVLPVIEPIARLEEALGRTADAELKLLCWEEARAIPLRSALPGSPPDRVALLIGPEGGFTEWEAERARDAGFIPVGLGPYILRAETAAVAAVAVLAYAFGDI
jgi:16S rRNA (uracil1498-N3)-methyltransferase